MIKLSKKLIEIGNETCNEEKHPEDDLTWDEEMKYANAEICYICEKSFNTNKKSKYYKNYKKVRDHYTAGLKATTKANWKTAS